MTNYRRRVEPEIISDFWQWEMAKEKFLWESHQGHGQVFTYFGEVVCAKCNPRRFWFQEQGG